MRLATLRTARRGDGWDVARLAQLATDGPVQLLRGRTLWGGGEPTETHVFGLVTIAPLGRLMDAYSDQGRRAARALADSVAEIDALAVETDAHGRGVGSAQLAARRRLEP